MLAAYVFLVLIIPSCSYATITIPSENNQNLVSCVTGIIKLYYNQKMITYVDINYDSNEIIKIINSVPSTIISRDTGKHLQTSNVEYVITVGTSTDFTSNFPNLMREPRWNPYAKFLIVVKSLKTEELGKVFDKLLKYHVNNVVLVNGTNNVDLYTYNPFDNYNCGKKYDKIIELGNCMATSVKDLYPYKLVTGLRNCTFIATTTHWPPYSIDPSKSIEDLSGAEQYVFQIISKLEQFEVRYTPSIDGEEFSTIGDNMSASGNMLMLQAQQTDVIFGGMLLIHFRADAFNYLCGHLPFTDDLRLFVQKAESVSRWKNLYLEFDTTVWIVLMVCFMGNFVILVIILRAKDKASVFFVMIDLFFLHGNKMISKSRSVFILFVIFAYLINTYYQAALVFTMTNPFKNYQIHTFKDLKDYNVQSCIWPGLQKLVNVHTKEFAVKQTDENGCMHVMDSLRTVSRTNKKFTVSLYSIYMYNKYLLYDKRGEELLYAFNQPVHNVIYAIYLYKGFPMQDQLNIHTIRMRETGLINKKLNFLYHRRQMLFVRTASDKTEKKISLIFPWYILLTGSIVATGLFLVELFFKKKSSRKTNYVRT